MVPAAVYVLTLTVAFLVVLSGLPRATTDYTRPGPYIGLGVSSGLEEFEGGSGFGDSASFTVRDGYRLSPYFAVEGLYELYG